MNKQHLILAEQIVSRNSKLSILNIIDNFSALHLPSKFNFDMAFICGPDWEQGDYHLNFKVRIEGVDDYELGTIDVKIAEKRSVFNAIAKDLNFVIGQDVKNVTFVVMHDDNEIFVRTYPVAYFFEVKTSNEGAQGENNEELELIPV